MTFIAQLKTFTNVVVWFSTCPVLRYYSRNLLVKVNQISQTKALFMPQTVKKFEGHNANGI